MSYPRKIHTLVIEDDSMVIESYKILFKSLAQKFDLVEPVFARSYSDARRRIESSEIYHVALLDLNLPINTQEQPDTDLALGEQLLEALAVRDSYPIPVVLVISGKLNLAESLDRLHDRLTNDFWYGRLVNKGPELHGAIEAGLTRALRYVDVGIHVRDSANEWYPTLSPREEDLLRRCVLAQESSIGVDLRWWAAEEGLSMTGTGPSANVGPTKVLMGNFLMDNGFGASIPTFFKFEPSGNAPYVHQAAGILSQKLGHVKVYHRRGSRHRSVIVTQSVTSNIWPVPLNEFLQQDDAQNEGVMRQIAGDIVDQLDQLGKTSEDEVRVSEVFGEYLDKTVLEKAWNSRDVRRAADHSEDPIATFEILKASKVKLWATRKALTHGDLNATNVAIDRSDGTRCRAFIFDAVGMRADLEFRDLAALEVTAVLFNSVGPHHQLIDSCRGFYGEEFIPSELTVSGERNNLYRSVPLLICAIRSRCRTEQQRRVYALLVFDAALRQMFGVGYAPSRNKVKDPAHACFLASWASEWLKKVAPECFA